jgi:hypothetical protein
VGGSSPVGLALAAAVGFGAFFLLLDAGTAAAPGGELWVITAVLLAALPLTVVAAIRQGASLRPALVLAPIAAVAVFDLLGDAALTFATTEGDIATVGVLASLDPLVTVLLAVALAASACPPARRPGWSPAWPAWCCSRRADGRTRARRALELEHVERPDLARGADGPALAVLGVARGEVGGRTHAGSPPPSASGSGRGRPRGRRWGAGARRPRSPGALETRPARAAKRRSNSPKRSRGTVMALTLTMLTTGIVTHARRRRHLGPLARGSGLQRLGQLEPRRLEAVALGRELAELGLQLAQAPVVGGARGHRLVQPGLAALELLERALHPGHLLAGGAQRPARGGAGAVAARARRRSRRPTGARRLPRPRLLRLGLARRSSTYCSIPPGGAGSRRRP